MGTTVLTPKSTHVEFDIPEELVGKELEITYTERSNDKINQPRKKISDFLGILSDKTAQKLREHIKIVRNEWDRDI